MLALRTACRSVPALFRAAVLVLLLAPCMATADDFKLVVHPTNPVRALPRSEASKLFLKKTTRWRNGATVVPVEVATKDVRDRFCASVHGKRLDAVKAYWNQLIFSGRDVPPLEKASDKAVL